MINSSYSQELAIDKSADKNSPLLLYIGTFLEFFDLMFFVHMASILNDHFFPKNDPHLKGHL